MYWYTASLFYFWFDYKNKKVWFSGTRSFIKINSYYIFLFFPWNIDGFKASNHRLLIAKTLYCKALQMKMGLYLLLEKFSTHMAQLLF